MSGNDLISRQAAIDALDMIGSVDTDADRAYATEIFMSLPSAQPYTEEQIQTMQDLESAEIEKAYELGRESAQQERKKGRWIRNDNGTYSCSVCQSWIPEEQHFYARYCLCCGADMNGEQP